LWSVQFDTTLADIFSIYDAISSRLVEEFSLQLTAVEQRELRKRDTQNPDAYRAYLLGRYYQSKLGRENLEKAIDYFKQAVSLDPEYALAYVGLASVDIGLPIGADYQSAGPAEAAKAAATKAIALDPALADAYAHLGFVKFWYEWDWPAAKELYRKAIALNPNDSSAHLFYGVVLSIEGHNAEAEREVEIARRLDPLSMQMNIITAQTYMQAHHFDAAEAQLKRALQINPNAFVPHLIEPLARIGHLLALRGESARAREVLGELARISKTRYVPPYNVALVHAGLDEKDKAFRLLDRACQERDVRLVFLRVDPVWDPLRSDPRFRNILSCTHQEP
jgi:tetratricopeptide (TPR) repeat protein